MLLKLLRYEFKCNYSKLAVTCLMNVIIVIIFSFFHTDHPAMVTTVAIISMIAFNVVGFIFLFQRYNTNLYSNEGYLTFTLPVKGYQILLSKLLIACLWLTIFGLASVPNMCLSVYCVDNSYLLKAYKAISSEIPATFFTVLNLVIGTFLNMLIIYFSISVAKLSIWRNFGTLMGFITFFATSIVGSMPYILLDKYLKNSATANNISFLYIYPSPKAIIDLVFSTAFCILLFYLTCYILDNKTNLK
ncbi:hypothetical protein [Clostridium oryzae]|uniref:ABC-2 family transporter protein n=1 Tax=Clostridium oryzae TaxID=1450648 RepID=A0A1V4I9P5_9CLOT|nr:hypothetical protein [Clostridium oryzae]OPJ56604.1 hypothetical protein CLORY_42520 [Clostridium oryzae]